MEKGFLFDFGDVLIDKVTGFTGNVIGRAQYNFQADQYYLKCRIPNAQGYSVTDWFDVDRLTLVYSASTVAADSKAEPIEIKEFND
jgi:hypothetical protein